MAFVRQEFESFRVVEFDYARRLGRALLRYSLDERLRFEEIVDFGGPPALSAEHQAGFEAALRLLHLAAGVSYYKAAAPPIVLVETGTLDAAEARWCHDLYDKGLREFAVRNQLRVPLDVQVVAPPLDGRGGTAAVSAPTGRAAPPAGLCVPVGGGKDSAVVVEALRACRPLLVRVGDHPSAARIAAAADLDIVTMERRIDPRLLEANAAGALNGHVPITAIVALVVVAGGFLWGYDTTVLAVERSADEPTRTVGGVPVNHQWSKSTEAELELQEVLRSSVHERVWCGSALRVFDELDIAACFAGLPKYHEVFRSCNGSFRQRQPVDGWCGECAKCRFVFLVLATAMAPAELVAIFGRDLLADADDVSGFADLLDPERKPFECVGTRDESSTAVRQLLADPRWRTEPIVRALADAFGLSAAEASGRATGRAAVERVLSGVRAALPTTVACP